MSKLLDDAKKSLKEAMASGSNPELEAFLLQCAIAKASIAAAEAIEKLLARQ